MAQMAKDTAGRSYRKLCQGDGCVSKMKIKDHSHSFRAKRRSNICLLRRDSSGSQVRDALGGGVGSAIGSHAIGFGGYGAIGTLVCHDGLVTWPAGLGVLLLRGALSVRKTLVVLVGTENITMIPLRQNGVRIIGCRPLPRRIVVWCSKGGRDRLGGWCVVIRRQILRVRNGLRYRSRGLRWRIRRG